MKSLQLEKPHAIIVIGIQGSGKSFFAEKFAETFSAPFLDDRQFLKLAKDKNSAKEIARTILQEFLKTKKTVVLETDGTRASRTDLLKLCKDAGYNTLLVWVQIDSATAMSRARKSAGVSQQQYKDDLKKFTAPHETEQALVISGKHTFASQAKVILKKLSTGNRPAVTQNDRIVAPAHNRGNIVVR